MKPGPYACQANSIIEQFPQAILILLKIKNSTDLEKNKKNPTTKKGNDKLGVVAQAFNSSPQEAETYGFLTVPGQLGLL